MLTICDYKICSSHVTSRYALAMCVAFYTNLSRSMNSTRLKEVTNMASLARSEWKEHAEDAKAELDLDMIKAQWRNLLVNRAI